MATIIIPNERPKSWNDYYAGQHWRKRQVEAQRVHAMVRAHLPQDAAVAEQPVHITVRAYFDKRPLDASNICAKFYEDGLIGWLIEDDSPAYVAGVTTYSLIDKEFPRVEIDVEEVMV